MKRFILAGLGLLALASTASAADLPRQQMPYKAPAYVSAFNWTGFYLGINGGGAWANSDWNGFGVNSKPSGGMFGVTAGYNWQGAGSPWVFGLEGDVDWSGVSGSSACGATTCETKNTWFGTGRGRIGYAVDRVMPYLTGGLAFGNIQANRSGFGSASTTNAGWTIGAGVEAALAPQWSAKVEYLYADIGSLTCNAAQCGTTTNVDLRPNILRAGVNYRF